LHENSGWLGIQYVELVSSFYSTLLSSFLLCFVFCVLCFVFSPLTLSTFSLILIC
jgi:hypothetical protein